MVPNFVFRFGYLYRSTGIIRGVVISIQCCHFAVADTKNRWNHKPLKEKITYENTNKIRYDSIMILRFYALDNQQHKTHKGFHHLFVFALYWENPYQYVIQLLPPLSALWFCFFLNIKCTFDQNSYHSYQNLLLLIYLRLYQIDHNSIPMCQKI